MPARQDRSNQSPFPPDYRRKEVRHGTQTDPHPHRGRTCRSCGAGTSSRGAAVNCAEHSKIVEFLGSHYSETLLAVGLINEAAVLEVYASERGSWTIVVTNVSGRSCVVFAGQNWEAVPVGPGVKT